MNITFNGVWRMDWGFGNPNLTAALLVCLFCVAWLPAYMFRKGFWFSLPLATVLGICLVHTMSRGGILGGITALAILAILAPRPWPKGRLIGAGCAIWMVIAATFLLNAHQRIGQGIGTEDKSVTHRLQIWKAAPQLCAIRPFGWGWNESGKAYMDWFLPEGRTDTYGSLVNTHLSKVVELGIFLGAFYLFLWFFAFYVSFPSSRSRWRAILFTLLLGFAVAGTFTNMARNWPLWILPIAAVVAALLDHIRLREKFATRPLLAGLALSCILPAALLWLGKTQLTIPLREENGAFVLGTGKPTVWILADEQSLDGNYRRKLREFFSIRSDLTIGLCNRIEQLPRSPHAPVLVASSLDASQANELLKRGSNFFFVKPTFSPADLSGRDGFHVIFGEFSKSKFLAEWSTSPKLIKLEGIGDYIPDWPQTLLEVVRISDSEG